MSAGYGPPAVNTFGMITSLGDAFGKSYDAARQRAQEDEAPALFGQLMGLGNPSAAAAPVAGPATAAPSRAGVPSFASAGSAMGDYLATTRAKESGGDDAAKNPSSTATGRYQFTQGTWNGLAKKYPDLGLTPNGRTDPAQQERAMQAFTDDNAKALTAAGVPINPGNLYVSHFLGEAGGPRFIAGAMSNPDAPATSFVTPGAASANRTIFFNRDGSPKTAGEVYAERTSRYAGGGPTVTPTLPTARTASAGPTMAVPAAPAPTATASADMPETSAQPAGFVIPGQGAPAQAAPAAQGFAGFGSPASRITPEQQQILTAAWKNPVTRPMATQIYGQLLKGRESQWQLSTMGDQPVLFNQATAQIVPVGQAKRQTATVDGAVIDTATGQPIYQAPEKGTSVSPGTSLVDPSTGRVIYQAPDKDSTKLQTVAPGHVVFDPSSRQPVFTAPAAERDEGAKVRDQVAAREAEGQRLGLTPGTPTAQTYALTGKIGRDQELSATDKKAIQEADEGVLSAQTAIDALNQAKTLSKQAYEGPTAGARSTVTSLFGSESGVATQDLNNVVLSNALGQLKAIFGGNPTEGERAILLQMQGSVNQPDVVRQKIFDRGIALAQKRLDFNQRRAEDLRGGTYYKQDGGKQDIALPKGSDRAPIPDGRSSGTAIAEAKSVLKSRPDLKPQLQERLRSWGIDPKRLDD